MSPSLTGEDASQSASQSTSQATLPIRPKLTRDTRSLGSAVTFTDLPPPALPSDTDAQSARSDGTEDLSQEAPSRLPDSTDDAPSSGSRLTEAGKDQDDDDDDDAIRPVSRKVSWADSVQEIPPRTTRNEPKGDRKFYLSTKGQQAESTSASSRGRSSAATPKGILKVKLPKDTPDLETEWASDVAEASASDEDQR